MSRSADDGRSVPGSPLIGAQELADHLAQDARPVLLDVRWALGDPHGHEHYLRGHIPGAVFVDLPRELAAPASTGGGRHPLPALDDLQAAARRWGLRAGGGVVVYDDTGGLAAGRAWWLLEWAGVEWVRILDGGLGAWLAAGQPLERGERHVAPGDVVLRAGRRRVLDIEEAAALARTGVLLDARAAERYRGEVEPVDPRAGHIPGAISAPTQDNLAADGRFLEPDALRRRFEALGIAPGATIGVYCGSGVTAAHEIAALTLAGYDAALFPGSWSQWAGEPGRAAATGPQAG